MSDAPSPAANNIVRQLTQHYGFTPKEVIENAKQLRISGRVDGNKLSSWLTLQEKLLREAKISEWSVDISKVYLLDEKSDAQGYRHRIIFQHSNISDQLHSILRAVNSTIESSLRAVPRHEVVEQPLVGQTGLTVSAKGKGASSLESASVGPNSPGWGAK